MDAVQHPSDAPDHSRLRGLSAVPIGALLIVSALMTWQVAPFANGWVLLLVAAAALAGIFKIQTHYDDRYGPVVAPKPHIAHGVALVVAIAAVLVLSWWLAIPVNAAPLMLAIIALAHYAFVVRARAHHLVIWGAVLVACLLPVWPDRPYATTTLMLGVALVLTGVLDHLALVRPVEPADHGA
jgi:hypothetical protein